MAYLQTPIVKIVTGPRWIVLKRDNFQTIPSGLVRFLRLVETCPELDPHDSTTSATRLPSVSTHRKAEKTMD